MVRLSEDIFVESADTSTNDTAVHLAGNVLEVLSAADTSSLADLARQAASQVSALSRSIAGGTGWSNSVLYAAAPLSAAVVLLLVCAAFVPKRPQAVRKDEEGEEEEDNEGESVAQALDQAVDSDVDSDGIGYFGVDQEQSRVSGDGCGESGDVLTPLHSELGDVLTPLQSGYAYGSRLNARQLQEKGSKEPRSVGGQQLPIAGMASDASVCQVVTGGGHVREAGELYAGANKELRQKLLKFHNRVKQEEGSPGQHVPERKQRAITEESDSIPT